MNVVRDNTIAALADAGPNQSVLCAALVQLQASIVGDDIENHTFEWEQTSGTPVTLINPNTLTPSFVNPQISDLEFTFYLDRYTPFEDSDVVIISRAPATYLSSYGGATAITGIGGFGTEASNISGVNQKLTNLDAHVTGWAYTNPPSARYSPIMTAEDLDRVRQNLNGSYWLMNDLDLSSYSSWDPIGTQTNPFSGEFQGNGFTINNMTIVGDGSRNIGLFGHANRGALIEKVGVTNANVSGASSSWYAAILVGSAAGNTNAVLDGGTLTVRNCWVEGTVESDSDRAGGLIGYTGTNVSTLFENTYADVTVTGGGTRTGGFVGWWETEILTGVENYWNETKTVAGFGSAGDTPAITEVDGRTSAQLQVRSLYEGWDFVNTWDWPQPYYGNVVLQFEFEGADGDTTTTDSSEAGRTLTFAGTTEIDDSQSATGSTSLNLSSSGKTSTDFSSDFQWPATQDFTLEMFTRFNGDPGVSEKAFLATWHTPNNASFLWRLDNNEMRFNLGNGSATVASDGVAWNPEGDRWYHIAICMKRGATDTLYFLADGEVLGTSVAFDGTTNVNGLTYFGMAIGSYWNSAGGQHGGWADGIRVTNDEALYTGPYTVPTGLYSTESPTESSATLQRDRTVVRSGGYCDDQWMMLWSKPTIFESSYGGAPIYTYKGAIVEEANAGGWSYPRFIPKERAGALMTPNTTHRITSVWDVENGSRIIPANTSKELRVINDKKFTSKNTSENFGPYANANVSGSWGGATTALNNLVLTISNPRKITMQPEETETYGFGGEETTVTNVSILRAVGAQMPIVEDAPSTYGTGGDVAYDLNLDLTRVNGASIG